MSNTVHNIHRIVRTREFLSALADPHCTVQFVCISVCVDEWYIGPTENYKALSVRIQLVHFLLRAQCDMNDLSGSLADFREFPTYPSHYIYSEPCIRAFLLLYSGCQINT